MPSSSAWRYDVSRARLWSRTSRLSGRNSILDAGPCGSLRRRSRIAGRYIRWGLEEGKEGEEGEGEVGVR